MDIELNTNEQLMMISIHKFFSSIKINIHVLEKYRTKSDRQSPVHNHISFDVMKRIWIEKYFDMLSRWMDSKENGDRPRDHYTKSKM